MSPTQAHTLVRGATGAFIGAMLATSPEAIQKLNDFQRLHDQLAAGLAHTLAHGRHGDECHNCEQARAALQTWLKNNPEEPHEQPG